MSWKIDQIVFKNFKFFKKEFTLPLERKHLLAHPTNPEEESLILQKIYTFVP